MTELIKGANATVPTSDLIVEVAWRAPGMDIDASALLITEAGTVRSDADFVFYNQPESPDGAVRHAGALPDGGDRLVVAAERLPDEIDRVVFTASIHDARARRPELRRHRRRPDRRPGRRRHGRRVRRRSAHDRDRAGLRRALPPGRGWKFRAVGQGYASGLAGIATDYGIGIDDEPAPPAPPAPAPASIDMSKARAVDLRKRVAAQAPVLLEKFDAAQVSLEKQGLLDERAEVKLVLDVSGSSRKLFRSGAYQELVDRFLAAALLFDDDGTIDTYLFDHRLHEAEPVTLAARAGWTDRQLQRRDLWGRTEYAPSIEAIAAGLVRGAAVPTYVAFVTDGGNSDRRLAAAAVKRASSLPAFFQFMAIGAEDDFPFLRRLDELSGREVDNAGFFAVEDALALADKAFYGLVMQEFPDWLAAARAAGILAA